MYFPFLFRARGRAPGRRQSTTQESATEGVLPLPRYAGDPLTRREESQQAPLSGQLGSRPGACNPARLEQEERPSARSSWRRSPGPAPSLTTRSPPSRPPCRRPSRVVSGSTQRVDRRRLDEAGDRSRRIAIGRQTGQPAAASAPRIRRRTWFPTATGSATFHGVRCNTLSPRKRTPNDLIRVTRPIPSAG